VPGTFRSKMVTWAGIVYRVGRYFYLEVGGELARCGPCKMLCFGKESI
jgi:hypothetical protein